jgi:hypothetical protein
VGIGWAATVSLPFAIMTEKVDKSRMGLFMGIFNLSVVIPQLVVSGVFGRFIAAAEDKSLVFIISTVARPFRPCSGRWSRKIRLQTKPGWLPGAGIEGACLRFL